MREVAEMPGLDADALAVVAYRRIRTAGEEVVRDRPADADLPSAALAVDEQVEEVEHGQASGAAVIPVDDTDETAVLDEEVVRPEVPVRVAARNVRKGLCEPASELVDLGRITRRGGRHDGSTLAEIPRPGPAEREQRDEVVDDLEAPGALTALANALDAAPGIAVVWGDVRNFGDNTVLRRLGKTLDPWLITYVNELPADAMMRREALASTPGWELKGGYEDWDLWMAFAERGFGGAHVPVLTGYYRVRSTRMLGETQQRHDEQFGLLRSRHPQLFADRAANRKRSSAPLRCKLLLPLIDALPLAEYTKQRLFRAVNRPGAALRARL